MRAALLAILVVGCGGQEAAVRPVPAEVVAVDPRLPRAPGVHGPSLVAIDDSVPRDIAELTNGNMLSDVDSCASCHPDAAAQWSTSAHSFASFGNPIYRFSIEDFRKSIGKRESQHCGGCHDMPLMLDGLLTADAPVPAADLRAHSGVTCRLCHGVQSSTKDGNGSYVWSHAALDAPELGNAASIAQHKKQVTTKVDTELCVSCHRGFISPDMNMPVHLSGLDEPGFWRNSAWTGNGMARIDKVEKKTCIDCHMEREPASKDELGAKSGKIASHRFIGGHTWMASMRNDADHLRRTQAKLEGAASIDIASARVDGAWQLPADGAKLAPQAKLELDVVIRNLLVGHRFPGGVLDIQDTWVELELVDAKGKRIASSGLAHETDPKDEDTHVLRTLVVDENGNVLEEHEMAKFRTQIATQTLAAREAHAVRYAFTIPAGLAEPVTVTARLRHRSRTLAMQAAVCKEAMSPEGKKFIVGAKGAREVTLDVCKPQPITLIAQATAQLGAGSTVGSARPAWERLYEHGMALVATVTERLEESRTVLEAALAKAPDARAKAMVTIQLGWVASKQGRVEDALALVARSRALLAQSVKLDKPADRRARSSAGGDAKVNDKAPNPPVLDAVAADALARVWRWEDAVAPAKSCTETAPQNSQAWVVYARVLGSVGDNAGALAAATKGLELAPRDQDLLRTQATALAALKRPEATAALAAFDRFRSPDQSAELRIQCAADSARCARDREQVHTIWLK